MNKFKFNNKHSCRHSYQLLLLKHLTFNIYYKEVIKKITKFIECIENKKFDLVLKVSENPICLPVKHKESVLCIRREEQNFTSGFAPRVPAGHITDMLVGS